MPLDEDEKAQIEQLLVVAVGFRARYGLQVRPSGLGAVGTQVLLALAESGALTVTELAEMLHRDHPTISRALKEVREQGWASEVPSLGRGMPHRLTTEGERAVTDYLERLPDSV